MCRQVWRSGSATPAPDGPTARASRQSTVSRGESFQFRRYGSHGECSWFFRRLIDFVEQAAFVEMDILGLLPAAEDFIDGEEAEPGKHRAVFGGGFLDTRPVEI